MSSTDRVRLKNLPPVQLCSAGNQGHPALLFQQQLQQQQQQQQPGFGTLPARRGNLGAGLGAGGAGQSVARPRRPLSQTIDDEFNNSQQQETTIVTMTTTMISIDRRQLRIITTKWQFVTGCWRSRLRHLRLRHRRRRRIQEAAPTDSIRCSRQLPQLVASMVTMETATLE
ncbi:hypothetical protein BOX15_Mlig021090g1 [Macrostomum lignano]|uniref:Uncharacterized protein n=1 Tax=Macrostomum lignano TaxID=282301 RepID=A0A267FEH8_9PLAT|nr:hypothetical protein BOX15_Mlig021090g1 [Macrostomum lignano]